MAIDLAIAAFIWTVAALVLPARSLPALLAPSLLFADQWPDDCARLHDRAQTGMRSVFGILGTLAWLTSGIFAFQPGAGALSAFPSIVVVTVGFVTLPIGRQVASRWELAAVRRHAEWLRDAEIAKYHVTPLHTPQEAKEEKTSRKG